MDPRSRSRAHPTAPLAVLLGVLALAGVPSLSGSSGLTAQEPITFEQLVALPAPPPAQRIAYGPDPLQFGHLRVPEGEGPWPVVVFVHGGCWLDVFDIGHAGPLEQALTDEGFAVWSLEYRRVGSEGGGWPGTFLDVAAGTDHLRELAGPHGLDLSTVIAAGHSAGGAFALWLAARGDIDPASALHQADPLSISGVFALAPAPDLEGLHEAGVCGNVIDRLMGGGPGDRGDRYEATSLMRLPPPDVPQTLVVGGRDEAWAPVGRRYHDRAAQADGVAGAGLIRLVELAGSGHFDMIAPGNPVWPEVLEALRELRQEVEARRGVG